MASRSEPLFEITDDARLRFARRRFDRDEHASDDPPDDTTSDLLASLAMDAAAAALLYRIVKAIDAGQPLLIEGPPGTGKTKSVALAAALMGRALTRVNFNVGTDAADVLARFAPDVEGERTWAILEGPIARACRAGRVVLLDELNLAPAAALDALLPLLERGRRVLRVPEVGLELPLHPDTCFVAAVNPVSSHHQGRMPLSAPMRSRFVAYQVPAPDAGAYIAAIRHLTAGRGVDRIALGGGVWAAPTLSLGQIAHPALGKLQGWSALTERLGRFVHDLNQRCRDRVIGAARREGYVVDRRRLAQFLDALDRLVRDLPPGTDVTDDYNECFDDLFLAGLAAGVDRDTASEQAQKLEVYPLEPGSLRRRPAAAKPPARSLMRALEPGARVEYQGAIWTVDQLVRGKLYIRNGRTRQSLPGSQVRGARRGDGVFVLRG